MTTKTLHHPGAHFMFHFLFLLSIHVGLSVAESPCHLPYCNGYIIPFENHGIVPLTHVFPQRGPRCIAAGNPDLHFSWHNRACDMLLPDYAAATTEWRFDMFLVQRLGFTLNPINPKALSSYSLRDIPRTEVSKVLYCIGFRELGVVLDCFHHARHPVIQLSGFRL